MLGQELGQERVARVQIGCDPAKPEVVVEQPALDLAGVHDPAHEGVRPERQQHLPAFQRAARRALHRLGSRREGAQVEHAEHLPQQPCGMLQRETVLADLDHHLLPFAPRFSDAHLRGIGHHWLLAPSAATSTRASCQREYRS
jgi:hypothetical protein